MSDKLWQNVTEFWAQGPTMRPSTQSVVRHMVWPNPDTQSAPLPVLPQRESKNADDSQVPSSLTSSLRPPISPPSRTADPQSASASSSARVDATSTGATTDGGEEVIKARALYAYTASKNYPNDLSFDKDDILDIVDRQEDWWQARKADGSVGTAPSNFLQILPLDVPHAPPALITPTSDTPNDEKGEIYQCKAKALYSYTASEDEPDDLSFSKDEILDIVDRQDEWWKAKKADGSVGNVPSNFLLIVSQEPGNDRGSGV
ncbi:hypothetical protein B0H12DRAFT_362209 [Mycena haematopus]|nr:hypothetical protein B0H12DRAFT_362209 [Mycena haematopus]